ncbi:hypothetical protein FACS1894199_11460 [Bacteroidia bacterium]|nr:hypothetical protein FACS1894199_11460 [Bacteroidia bacterium]
MRSLRTFPVLYNLTRKEFYDRVLEALKNGYTGIHPDIYNTYADNLRKAVTSVPAKEGSSYYDVQQQMKANVSRFAAYKAWQATRKIEQQRADKNGVERSEVEFKRYGKIVLNAYNRYQVAEYNTSIARARTAKQWVDFNSDDVKNKLYPSLKWLPSRSADLREAHKKFYGLVLPKNHPFWLKNQPGNLWNCKCDWEETDATVFTGDLPPDAYSPGLEGNPGQTGEVFSEDASYFQVRGEKNKAAIEREYIKFERPRLLKDYSPKEHVKYSNLSTGDLLENEKPYDRLLSHCGDSDQIVASSILPYHIKELKNPIYSALGATKDMKNPKDVKNIVKKKRRGIVGYNIYEWNYKETKYRVFLEVHKDGFEQLYAIYKFK